MIKPGKLLQQTRGVGRAVMIEHTIFSLPFAAAAFLLESRGHPPLMKVLWIILAVFGARNAANALNRLIDRDIDAANPRTAQRDLPAGKVTSRQLWLFTALCGLLFLTAAWMLNPLCLFLSPVAALLIALYSYTKRVTWLCHYWLGLCCSMAVMGSFLAMAGRFELRFFPLTAGTILWFAGFDIIYAIQDIDHDRKVGLHSIPARFGKPGALALSGLSHLGALFFWGLTAAFYPLGFWFFTGLAFSAVLLGMEQIIARKGSIKKIPLAAYHLNQLLSPVFLFFTVLDIYFKI